MKITIDGMEAMLLNKQIVVSSKTLALAGRANFDGYGKVNVYIKFDFQDVKNLLSAILFYRSMNRGEKNVDTESFKTSRKKESALKIKQIKCAICETFNVTYVNLSSRCRTIEYVIPRHLGIVLSLGLTSSTLSEIGLSFGKHHSSAIHAIRNFSNLISKNPLYKELCVKVIKKLDADFLIPKLKLGE